MWQIVNKCLMITIILSVVLFISSCHKENTSLDFNQSVETIRDYVEAQQMTDLLLNTYFKSITDSTLLTDGIAEIDGASVIYSVNPAKIIIDYYIWSREDGYGHYRKGRYEAKTATSFFDSLAVVNFTFHSFDYDFDSINVTNFSLTNMGNNTDGNYLFSVNATNFYRKFHDTTGQILYHVDQDFIRVKDPLSPYYTNNDSFNISGNLSGVARNGYSFNSIVHDTSCLIDSFSCQWLIDGTSEVNLPESDNFTNIATINFSNSGDCRNQYSIIINGSLLTKAFDKE